MVKKTVRKPKNPRIKQTAPKKRAHDISNHLAIMAIGAIIIGGVAFVVFLLMNGNYFPSFAGNTNKENKFSESAKKMPVSFGKALVLKGENSTLSIGRDLLPTLQNTFTIESWVRFDNEGDKEKNIYSIGDRLSMVYKKNKSGKQIAITSSDGSFSNSWSVPLNLKPNVWNHVALFYSSDYNPTGEDNGSFILYINGSSYFVPNMAFSDSNKPLLIGSSDNIMIDEVRVSSNSRYPEIETPSTYSLPTSPFVQDDNTLLLLHFDDQSPSNEGSKWSVRGQQELVKSTVREDR